MHRRPAPPNPICTSTRSRPTQRRHHADPRNPAPDYGVERPTERHRPRNGPRRRRERIERTPISDRTGRQRAQSTPRIRAAMMNHLSENHRHRRCRFAQNRTPPDEEGPRGVGRDRFEHVVAPRFPKPISHESHARAHSATINSVTEPRLVQMMVMATPQRRDPSRR